MEIRSFFDPATWTLTYLVWDDVSRDAIIIDPVLDYDPLKVQVHEASLQRLLGALKSEGLTLRAVLETHAHADHLSGAHRLRQLTGAKVGIGEMITKVQGFFKGVFGLSGEFQADGRQFDVLFKDGQEVHFGALTVRAIATPGHTPACVSYLVGDALFTGDTLFMPDYGTGRCDFPSGSASDLWESIQRLYQLPDATRVFVGHDYQPGGREVRWETTIGESKRRNLQLRAETPRDEFVAFRNGRDRTLKLPNLIFQSIQVNIRAGELPPAEENGRSYLKLPINLFG